MTLVSNPDKPWSRPTHMQKKVKGQLVQKLDLWMDITDYITLVTSVVDDEMLYIRVMHGVM